MTSADVVVVGGGISGASLGLHAARSGRSVVVIEAGDELGGALATVREPGGYWFELGAHTLYNSYGATLELVEAAGLKRALVPRGKPVLRFLEADGHVGKGKNLGALVSRFSKLELLASIPRWIGAKAEGKTVAEHYGRLVGRRNYERVLGPMVSAVPSQRADELPADMLFKKRERREDVMRSFTFEGGVRTLVEGVVQASGAEVVLGRKAVGLRELGEGWRVELEGGEAVEGAIVALAVAPSQASALLRSAERAGGARTGALGRAADAATKVREAGIETLGLSVARDAVQLDYATFLIPLEGQMRSVVTRDVVADEERRAFTFHFEPGLALEERRARAAEVLGLAASELARASEREGVLPSPRKGHAGVVAELDRALSGLPLVVTGNWFGGLAIEDCSLRSRAEWERIARA